MPAAAGVWLANIAIGAVTAAGGIATVGLATAAYWVGATVATLAISAGLAKVSAALMGRPKLGSSMRSRNLVVRDPTMPRTILYGTGMTGGVVVYQNTSGTKNEYLDFVVAVAGHQITAITDVWFDDIKIANADINSGNAAGGAVGGSSEYAGVAWIYKYLGTDTQAASSILTAAYTGEWTADHRGRGNAYVHIRLKRDKEIFDQGPPGNFRFGFQGAKVYDPRKDTTAGGTGTHRVADPSTWEYSNNPALCCADYLIGGSITNSATRVAMRGFGASPDDVDWASVTAAANICDESVTVPDSSASPLHASPIQSTTQNRYECDGALSSGEAPAENLEQLLTSMMGQIVYSSGQYRLFAGAYDAATLTLNESDLSGPIEYVTGGPRSDRYNAVKGVRWDSTTGQQVEFLPKTNAAYEAEDGGSRLYRDIELPFTTDEYRAQRIAQLILARSREQQTLVFRGNLGCLRVGVWDTVAVTITELGLSGKVFRCISRDVQPSGNDHIVLLTLREEFAATYTDPVLGDYDDITPVTPWPAPADYRSQPGFSLIYDPEFEWGDDAGDLQYWAHSSHVTYRDSDCARFVLDGLSNAYVRTRAITGFDSRLFGTWGVGIAVRYRVVSSSPTFAASTPQMAIKVYAARKAFSYATAIKTDELVIDLTDAAADPDTWYTASAVLAYQSTGELNYWAVIEAAISSLDVSAGIVEIDYLEGMKMAVPANYSANVGGTVPKVTSLPSGKVLSDSGTWVTNGNGYPITNDEQTAGLVEADIINDTVPPGYVTRYGDNTTPGTTDMSGAFNKASLVIDYYDIVVPPGIYLLSSQWAVTAPLYRRAVISGYGSELRTDTTIAALKIEGKSTPHGVTVEGIKVNARGGDSEGTGGASQQTCGFDIVGTDHCVLRDCVVEANNTSATYAGFRIRQADTGVGDTGAFWTLLEKCTVRKRAGADAGTIARCVSIYGQCNGTVLRGCDFMSATYGVNISVEDGTIAVANGVVIDGCTFEGLETAIRALVSPTHYWPLGLRVVNNRFEAINQACATFDLTSGTSAQNHATPPYFAGNSTDSSVVSWIYNPYDAFITDLNTSYYGAVKDQSEYINGNKVLRMQNTDASPTPANLVLQDLAGSSTYQFGHLVMGTTHFWLGSDGALRYKATAPTSQDDGTPVALAGGSTGNPTALVGTAAVNGVAATYMRSDAAPAIDQAMSPTWTGVHTHDNHVDIRFGYGTGYLASTSSTAVSGATVVDYGITYGVQHTGWSGLGTTLSGYYGIGLVTAGALRVQVTSGGLITITGGTYNTGHIVLGSTHLWLGSDGSLRYKSSTPSSADDGSPVAGSAAAANPTATVGTAAVNGSASTYMRSDAAPAINQGMTPTWTGTHTYNAHTNWGYNYRIGALASSSFASVYGATIADYGVTFGTTHTDWGGPGISLQGYYGIMLATGRLNRVEIDSTGLVKASGNIQVAGGTVAGAAGTISLGSSTTTSATAGAYTLPANPAGFLQIGINGSIKKIPYYN